ncbi:hypothetical protein COU74_01960 [Candidatus Peregrinibacteria bacterium CG10_big_fil_rev_8_21_14_0_10_36_19]|nr:MAG: hypothetical protein COU74_01960 [Candidatus Peregrinibacteria bacterium CG10_big_fil_rev_8_21_14_0_10_36_19]
MEQENKPEINNYNQPNEEPKPSFQPVVDPTKKTIGQIKTNNVNQQQVDPNLRKQKIKKIVIITSIILIVLAITSVVLASQTSPTKESAIASLFGISQISFVNILTIIVHIAFLYFSIGFFILTMAKLVRALKTPKEDLLLRRKNIKSTIITAIALFVLFISWGATYLYMDSKHVTLKLESTNRIITDPEDTIALEAPVKVKFDASKILIDPNYRVIAYDWDFGDRSTDTSQVITHTFEKKGRYDVVLTITRRHKKTGEELQDAHSVTVIVDKQLLSAIFSVDQQSGEAPLKVNFDASESIDPDDKIELYEWDFDGDGKFEEDGKKATHIFEKDGKFTATLRVTNSNGETATAEKEIIVKESEGPVAVISILDEPEALTVGQNYTFKSDDSVSPNGKITSYDWSMGDNSGVKRSKTISHSYNKPGTYEITLKIVDEEGKEGEVKKVIKVGSVKGTPKAVIKTSPTIEKNAVTLNGEAPFKVSFDATGSTDSDGNIVDYKWDFDSDGKDDAFGPKTTHTFSASGIYTTTLTVVDADNLSSRESITVNVAAQGITAKIKANIIQGTVPLTVNFDASGSSFQGGTITSYQWDFGDGTAPKLGSAQIGHKYTEIGTYTVKVTAIGSNNSKDTDEILITVREVPLAACFTSVFTEGQVPLTTTFDPSCSTGSVKSYFWDFGDGSSSDQIKPSHTFQSTGEYNVRLEITDSENTVSTKDITIKVTP